MGAGAALAAGGVRGAAVPPLHGPGPSAVTGARDELCTLVSSARHAHLELWSTQHDAAGPHACSHRFR